MRFRRLAGVLLISGLVAACGWSPPGAAPPSPDTCTPNDGPTAATVTSALTALAPAVQGGWKEVDSGHTKNCRLYWVQVGAGTDAAAPQHLLFLRPQYPARDR